MRILLCISTLSTGGSERQLSLLAVALRELGHEVHVLYKVPGRFLHFLKENGVTCHNLHTYSNYSPTLFLKFFNLVKKIQPDIIHSWLEMMDVLAGLASKIYNIPWIASERSAGGGRKNPIGWCRNQLAKTTVVIANSEAAALRLRGQNFSKLQVITNAVEVPNATETSYAKFPLRLLAVSRLTATKNLFRLFESLETLKAHYPHFTLTIVGDGQERPSLETEARRRNLMANVQFEGEQYALSNYYQHASLFISVSLLEGQPNSVLEAASYKIPLILSDIPAHVESFGPEGALFCSALETHSIVVALKTFIEESCQPTLQRTEIAYQKVQKRSPLAVATEYETVYKSVLTQFMQERSQIPRNP